jgi:hypothetical protein
MAKSIAKQTLSLGALALWALTASPLSYAKSEKRKPARFYAVGARIDGAVAFDMASLAEKDGLRSLRVWEFSPTPVATTDGFKAGSVRIFEALFRNALEALSPASLIAELPAERCVPSASEKSRIA